jgi:hypothetical protein
LGIGFTNIHGCGVLVVAVRVNRAKACLIVKDACAVGANSSNIFIITIDIGLAEPKNWGVAAGRVQARINSASVFVITVHIKNAKAWNFLVVACSIYADVSGARVFIVAVGI